MRVLIVEDTFDVGEAIVEGMLSLGHAVDWVQSAEDAIHILDDTDYQLMILDLMLPGANGTTVLKRLRDCKIDTSVLVLTARSAIDDRVEVLDSGADDYMVKPFDFRELKARARSLLRRHSTSRSNELSFGPVTLDRTARAAFVGDSPIDLTRRELSVLEVFMARPRMIFSKTQLLDHLFGYGSEPGENAIEVLIARLRRKLAGSGLSIITRHGIGYQIATTSMAH